MSARFVCPNDGEVLNIVVDASKVSSTSAAESYQCAYCHYKATKVVVQTLKVVDETYVPPSKQKGK